MITVFINKDGYVISGGNVEIAKRCHQRNDTDDIHHQYKVLAAALAELISVQNTEDILVYNNTRIMDEVNRLSQPLDEGCSQWANFIRRDLLTKIKSMVYFAKKSSSFIDTSIKRTFDTLLDVDCIAVKTAMEKRQEKTALNNKQKVLKKFKNGRQ